MMCMKNFRLALILCCFSLLMLACNLARQAPGVALQPTTNSSIRATAVPPRPSITPLFGAVVATPTAGGVIIGAQVASTPVLGVTLAPPQGTPGAVTVTIPTGQINNFLSYLMQNIIVPIVNLVVGMVSSSVTYLWQMAGLQGGWVAQVGCCIVPIIVGIVYLLRGGGRRRRGGLFGWF